MLKAVFGTAKGGLLQCHEPQKAAHFGYKRRIALCTKHLRLHTKTGLIPTKSTIQTEIKMKARQRNT